MELAKFQGGELVGSGLVLGCGVGRLFDCTEEGVELDGGIEMKEILW